MHHLRFHALILAFVLSISVNSVSADPALPLPRMPICGDQDGSVPLVLNCSRLSLTPDVQLYRVPGSGPTAIRFNFVYRDALFKDELVVFRVDDSAGSLGTFKPGDPGYLTAAWQRAQVIFASGSTASTPDATLQFNGGDLLVYVLVQNATLGSLQANNPGNQLGASPLAFFSLDRLNPDAVDHLVGFSNALDGYSQFGFEDWTSGGDRDYDDVAFDVTPPLQPLIGPIALAPSSASLKVGQTYSMTATVTDLNNMPVAGQPVTFTITGTHPLIGFGTTNGSGQANFAYSANTEGADSIGASATVNGQTVVSNMASASWSLYRLLLPVIAR